MEEKNDIDRLVGSYKQTNALLMVVGVLLSTYTINSTSFDNALSSVVAILIVIFGAYQYYKIDNGKIGLILIAIAVIYAIGYVLMYLKFV
ncbi:hypothetical protein [Methanobacterium spitsbergense]|uniref:Uncharacterized protein n=1 Tax=Methanobacterium spitsbergense TaxID=2874285 RepID=A0A8T5UZN1_9EURY|nr:hypothetical protein [Methanobacterium spitsbergense]MBZ2165041.1 hypothetical protein [Methanobacterium spitsbergense]